MGSVLNKLSYSKLKNEEAAEKAHKELKKILGRRYKTKKLSGRRITKPRVQIPILRKFLRRRNKLLVFSNFMSVSWVLALKRMKNGQAHLNDLFGRNYMLMQVNPVLSNLAGNPHIPRKV